MKKGDIIRGTISSYSFPNKGSFLFTEKNPDTGEDITRKITTKGKEVLPGAEVEVKIKKKRADSADGIFERIVTESPLVTRMPLCNHFYECGGCTYQTVAYEKQLEIKEKMVKEMLLPYIGRDFEWEGILPSPDPFHYKNKMEFTFGDAEQYGPLTLGLHRQGSSYDILSIDSCAIVRPAWNEILKYTVKYFRDKKVPFYHKMQHCGILRNLVIRQSSSDGGIMVNLVTTTREDLNVPKEESGVNEALVQMNLDEWVNGMTQLFESDKIRSLEGYNHLAGIVYTENDSFSDAIVPEKVMHLYGDDYLMEKVLGLEFKITPFSFFQTNTKGAEILYAKVREYVKFACKNNESSELLADTIFDLYSGTGTIAQLMAPVANKVVGVEIIPEAVESARSNAKLNKLKNCEFICGDVLKKLDDIEEKPDFIILDPPRDGVNPKALNKIIDYGVKNIVYISCKPTSLLRDLELFYKAGYRMKKGCCADNFAQTCHVETVVLMSRVENQP